MFSQTELHWKNPLDWECLVELRLLVKYSSTHKETTSVMPVNNRLRYVNRQLGFLKAHYVLLI